MLALRHFLPVLRGHHVLIRTDKRTIKNTPGWGSPPLNSLILACTSVVFGPVSSPRWSSVVDSSQEGPPIASQGHNISPPAGDVETLSPASEGDQFLNAGLSTKLVETILNSRAPSIRKLYIWWRVFTLLCRQHRLDPVNCSVASVLEFLQERFSACLSPSALKVYVAAIAAFRTATWIFGEVPFGILFPSWYSEDEAQSPGLGPNHNIGRVVLANFEPLDLATKCIALKMAFLCIN